AQEARDDEARYREGERDECVAQLRPLADDGGEVEDEIGDPAGDLERPERGFSLDQQGPCDDRSIHEVRTPFFEAAHYEPIRVRFEVRAAAAQAIRNGPCAGFVSE